MSDAVSRKKDGRKMDQPGYCTNSHKIADFIGLLGNLKIAGASVIQDLYLKERLTAREIAFRLGTSETSVLRQLHALGIRRETINDIAEASPRRAVRAPYGQRVIGGKLVANNKELKVARLIIELKERRRLSWNEVAKHLNLCGYRTRNGLLWKLGTTKNIFDRWKGKL